ncbi:hypothetical protein K1719_037205 [Acacia pycnantha]|nr:hypothetical protein K1719_037205 [Acacia pycnantha]
MTLPPPLARMSFEGSTPVSIPTWFTVDTKLGCLSFHLDAPQCFSAEMYSADLNIVGKPEVDKNWLQSWSQSMDSKLPMQLRMVQKDHEDGWYFCLFPILLA